MLPVIVFFASLTSILFHLGWLQKVVDVLGGGLGRLLGTERAESVNAAANIFLGQTEAPPVSYTHLDVYKRQGHSCGAGLTRPLPTVISDATVASAVADRGRADSPPQGTRSP